jgi:hypothetical protein
MKVCNVKRKKNLCQFVVSMPVAEVHTILLPSHYESSVCSCLSPVTLPQTTCSCCVNLHSFKSRPALSGALPVLLPCLPAWCLASAAALSPRLVPCQCCCLVSPPGALPVLLPCLPAWCLASAAALSPRLVPCQCCCLVFLPASDPDKTADLHVSSSSSLNL